MSTKFYIKDDNGTFLSTDGKTRFSCLEGQALYQFLNSDQGKARRFDVEINDDGDRIGVEIAPEWRKRIRAERNHQEYLDQQKAASDIEFISYNLLVRANETEVEMIQTIADESVEVEAEAMKSIEMSILRDALKHLSSAEYAIVFELFLSNSPLTELQLANKLNITQQAVSKRKKAILEKLRKIFEIPGCEISEKSGIRDERRNSLSRTLKNEYEQDAEANTHRTVKGKLSDRSARTP